MNLGLLAGLWEFLSLEHTENTPTSIESILERQHIHQTDIQKQNFVGEVCL